MMVSPGLHTKESQPANALKDFTVVLFVVKVYSRVRLCRINIIQQKCVDAQNLQYIKCSVTQFCRGSLLKLTVNCHVCCFMICKVKEPYMHT